MAKLLNILILTLKIIALICFDLRGLCRKMSNFNSKKNIWNKCTECNYFESCNAGKNKTKNYDSQDRMLLDVGCYNHNEFYNAHRKQLPLFGG